MLWFLESDENSLNRRFGWTMPAPFDRVAHDRDRIPREHLCNVAFRFTRMHDAAINFYQFFSAVVPEHLEKMLDAPWEVLDDAENARRYMTLARLSDALATAMRSATGVNLFCMVKTLEEQRGMTMWLDLRIIEKGFDELGLPATEALTLAVRKEFEESVLDGTDDQRVAEELEEAGLGHLEPALLPRFLFIDGKVCLDGDELTEDGDWGGIFQGKLLFALYSRLLAKRPARLPLAPHGHMRAPLDVTGASPRSLVPVTSGSIAYVGLMISLNLQSTPSHALAELLSVPEKSLSLKRYQSWLKLLRSNTDKLAVLLTDKWDPQLAADIGEPQARDTEQNWERAQDIFPGDLNTERDSMVPDYSSSF